MKAPTPCRLETFWQQLRAAAAKVLLLDYDGTLAPFQLQRDKAFPYPGVPDILNKIQDSGKTRLIIISGRAVRDLKPLLGLDPRPELWGSHGFERLLPNGRLQTEEIGADCLHNLEKASAWMMDHGHGLDCEKKPSSLAFHWRGMEKEKRRQLAQTIRHAWAPLTEGVALEIHSFDGGLELRCGGFNKGRAVRKVLAECDPDSAVAYLGDDRTDEDAFQALHGKGLSVLVRDTYRDTLADCWLRPPVELLDFLKNWQIFSEQ
jgi:trehalose 6-phosphate phosphatase